MKRIIAFVILLGVFGVGAGVSAQANDELVCDALVSHSDDQRITYYMGEGAAFYSMNNYNNAILSYSCIIEQIDDAHIPAYLQRASTYLKRQNYELALADYDRVLALDGNHRSAYNNRGVVYTAQKQYNLALVDFDRAIALDSDYVTAYSNRAVLHALAGSYDVAVSDLNQVIAISNIDELLSQRQRGMPIELTDNDRVASTAYALLGIIRSTEALDYYRSYQLLMGQLTDARIIGAADSIESRLTFELRLEDGTWLLSTDFDALGEDIGW